MLIQSIYSIFILFFSISIVCSTEINGNIAERLLDALKPVSNLSLRMEDGSEYQTIIGQANAFHTLSLKRDSMIFASSSSTAPVTSPYGNRVRITFDAFNQRFDYNLELDTSTYDSSTRIKYNNSDGEQFELIPRPSTYRANFTDESGPGFAVLTITEQGAAVEGVVHRGGDLFHIQPALRLLRDPLYSHSKGRLGQGQGQEAAEAADDSLPASSTRAAPGQARARLRALSASSSSSQGGGLLVYRLRDVDLRDDEGGAVMRCGVDEAEAEAEADDGPSSGVGVTPMGAAETQPRPRGRARALPRVPLPRVRTSRSRRHGNRGNFPDSGMSAGAGVSRRPLLGRWADCYPGGPVRMRTALAVDVGAFGALGGELGAVTQAVMAAASQVSAVYYAQLGVALTVHEVLVKTELDGSAWSHRGRGEEGSTCPDPAQYNQFLATFASWRRGAYDDTVAVATLLTDCFPPPGVVGLAYVGRPCDAYGSNFVNVGAMMWLTLAHEDGHAAFGASHTSTDGSTGGFMDYGSGKLLADDPYDPGEYGFSHLSRADICATLAANVGKACFSAYDGPSCGNGLLEPGEECDAGPGGSACCTAQCTLAAGASCAGAGPCCRDCVAQGSGTACTDLDGKPGVCQRGTCARSRCSEVYGNVFFCGARAGSCYEQCRVNAGRCGDAYGGHSAAGTPCALPEGEGGGEGVCVGGGGDDDVRTCVKRTFSWRINDVYGACECDGHQYRTLTCVDNAGSPVGGDACADAPRPQVAMDCPPPDHCQPPQWMCKNANSGNSENPDSGYVVCSEASFGECSTDCGTGTRVRDVVCARQGQELSPGDACDPASRPAASQACSADGGCRYKWMCDAGDGALASCSNAQYGACSTGCGDGERRRNVICTNQNDAPVSSEFCETFDRIWGTAKPAEAAPCSSTQGCPYKPSYAWVCAASDADAGSDGGAAWSDCGGGYGFPPCTASCTGDAAGADPSADAGAGATVRRLVKCAESSGEGPAVLLDDGGACDGGAAKPVEEAVCPCSSGGDGDGDGDGDDSSTGGGGVVGPDVSVAWWCSPTSGPGDANDPAPGSLVKCSLPRSWGLCSSSCGPGQQARAAVCRGSDGSTVAASVCEGRVGPRPSESRACLDLETCDYAWRCYRQGGAAAPCAEEHWSECPPTCGEAARTRLVGCFSSSGDFVSPDRCEGIDKPASSADCVSRDTCQWVAGQWSQCPCARFGAIQPKSRAVSCIDRSTGRTVDSAYCPASMQPAAEGRCTPTEHFPAECPAGGRFEWDYGIWGPCSSQCGPGYQVRDASCTLTWRPQPGAGGGGSSGSSGAAGADTAADLQYNATDASGLRSETVDASLCPPDAEIIRECGAEAAAGAEGYCLNGGRCEASLALLYSSAAEQGAGAGAGEDYGAFRANSSAAWPWPAPSELARTSACVCVGGHRGGRCEEAPALGDLEVEVLDEDVETETEEMVVEVAREAPGADADAETSARQDGEGGDAAADGAGSNSTDTDSGPPTEAAPGARLSLRWAYAGGATKATVKLSHADGGAAGGDSGDEINGGFAPELLAVVSAEARQARVELPAELPEGRYELTVAVSPRVYARRAILVAASLCAGVSCAHGHCDAATGACVCPEGRSGETCAVDETLCDKCNKYGSFCSVDGSAATCHCSPGFSGPTCHREDRCDELLDALDAPCGGEAANCVHPAFLPKNCTNGWLVTSAPESACDACECRNQWSGELCDACTLCTAEQYLSHNDCSSCTCRPGFGGPDCSCKGIVIKIDVQINAKDVVESSGTAAASASVGQRLARDMAAILGVGAEDVLAQSVEWGGAAGGAYVYSVSLLLTSNCKPYARSSVGGDSEAGASGIAVATAMSVLSVTSARLAANAAEATSAAASPSASLYPLANALIAAVNNPSSLLYTGAVAAGARAETLEVSDPACSAGDGCLSYGRRPPILPQPADPDDGGAEGDGDAGGGSGLPVPVWVIAVLAVVGFFLVLTLLACLRILWKKHAEHRAQQRYDASANMQYAFAGAQHPAPGQAAAPAAHAPTEASPYPAAPTHSETTPLPAASTGAATVAGVPGQSPASEQPLPPGWEEHRDDRGRRYYWHRATDESRWVQPGLDLASDPWTAQADAQGRRYYWNAVTGESRWEMPCR